jgi:class 3 adenylate cyclase
MTSLLNDFASRQCPPAFASGGSAASGAANVLVRTSTFLFADLVGYSAWTERCGDIAAARVAAEFGRAMARLSREHGAWFVQSMGDGAMISAPSATQAVALAVHAVEEVGTRPDLLPVRIGAHTGFAVLCDGDWYGNAVNLVARLTREARPNEVLVSGSTQAAAGDEHQGSLTGRGEVTLRGLNRPVVVWRLVPKSATKRAPASIVGATHTERSEGSQHRRIDRQAAGVAHQHGNSDNHEARRRVDVERLERAAQLPP